MEIIIAKILLGKPLTEREKAKFMLFCENETLAEWAYEVEE